MDEVGMSARVGVRLSTGVPLCGHGALPSHNVARLGERLLITGPSRVRSDKGQGCQPLMPLRELVGQLVEQPSEQLVTLLSNETLLAKLRRGEPPR